MSVVIVLRKSDAKIKEIGKTLTYLPIFLFISHNTLLCKFL